MLLSFQICPELYLYWHNWKDSQNFADRMISQLFRSPANFEYVGDSTSLALSSVSTRYSIANKKEKRGIFQQSTLSIPLVRVNLERHYASFKILPGTLCFQCIMALISCRICCNQPLRSVAISSFDQRRAQSGRKSGNKHLFYTFFRHVNSPKDLIWFSSYFHSGASLGCLDCSYSQFELSLSMSGSFQLPSK